MRLEVLRANHISKQDKQEKILSDFNISLFQASFHMVMVRSSRCHQVVIDILSGRTSPDDGKLYLYDKPDNCQSRNERESKGVYAIYKQPSLISHLSIAENIFLTDKSYYTHGFVNTRLMRNVSRKLLSEAGLCHIRPEYHASVLSVFEAHKIEIISAVSKGARILLLDNIAEKYTDTEQASMMEFLFMVMEADVSIIYISPKYNMFYDFADYATIVHHGNTVITLGKEQITKNALLDYYSIRKKSTGLPEANIGPVIFKMQNIAADGIQPSFNLQVHKGEVVGIWDENWTICSFINSILAGKTSYTGNMLVGKKDITGFCYKQRINNGLVYINENSIFNQVFYNMSLFENISLLVKSPLYDPPRLYDKGVEEFLCKYVLTSMKCEYMIEKYGCYKTLPPLPRHEQLKIVLAKWLCTKPKIIILENPCLHFDDVTISELVELIKILQSSGLGILVMSMNQKEILKLADTAFTVTQTKQLLPMEI